MEIIPYLLRYTPSSFKKIRNIGLIISAFTILILDLALLHEMSGLLVERPFDVLSFIIVLSFLVGAAVLFYPFLLAHYRLNVYVDEEAEGLDAKYREGLQEFQLQKGKRSGFKITDAMILREMSQKDPNYQDFAYLYTTYKELLRQQYTEINKKINEGRQTLEQAKKDILRKLIYATAWENLEDSGYSISSYCLPVSYCMIAVAFGFILLSIIPLLGTATLKIGETSINLVWATGGFIGAYIYSFLPFFQRCTRRDMPPRAFLYYALKVFLGPIAVVVFGNILFSTIPESGIQFAGSVALGSVPFWALAELRKFFFARWNWSKKEIGSRNIYTVPGITYEYAERLYEEGIMNIQNLAYADPENLSKRTMLNRDMIFDWKNQAILMLLTEDMSIENLKSQKGGK